MAVNNFTNIKIGKLTPIKICGKNKYNTNLWECKCECGNIVVKLSTDLSRALKENNNISCGCLRHGKRNHPLYPIWDSMKRRCENENNPEYKNYGGRGIDVCEEWKNDFMTFYNWAINSGYQKGLSIDRIENNKGYEPGNCRFVTMKIQQNNRRNNHRVIINNIEHTLAEWEEISGINQNVLWYRIKNKCEEKDLLNSVRSNRKNK
jgi:hypothetical protein